MSWNMHALVPINKSLRNGNKIKEPAKCKNTHVMKTIQERRLHDIMMFYFSCNLYDIIYSFIFSKMTFFVVAC